LVWLAEEDGASANVRKFWMGLSNQGCTQLKKIAKPWTIDVLFGLWHKLSDEEKKTACLNEDEFWWDLD